VSAIHYLTTLHYTTNAALLFDRSDREGSAYRSEMKSSICRVVQIAAFGMRYGDQHMFNDAKRHFCLLENTNGS